MGTWSECYMGSQSGFINPFALHTARNISECYFMSFFQVCVVDLCMYVRTLSSLITVRLCVVVCQATGPVHGGEYVDMGCRCFYQPV